MNSQQHLTCRTVVACLLMLALFASGASASPEVRATNRIAMDQVHWLSTSDRFRCELELPLQKFGALTFRHAAGDSLHLAYTPATTFSGAAHIAAVTPPWQAAAHSRFEPLEASSSGAYRLPSEQASALLGSMDQGLWTLLRLDQKELVVPTIRWETVSSEFQACRQALSPLSVQQARDWTLYYQSGQRALSHEQLDQLEELSQYLTTDPEVTRVLVDAYTDNTGSRIANLQVSRERAADVAAALRSGGVSGEMIEQRAHGDRYPSADNSTPEGRNLNRKVTIRVIRQDG